MNYIEEGRWNDLGVSNVIHSDDSIGFPYCPTRIISSIANPTDYRILRSFPLLRLRRVIHSSDYPNGEEKIFWSPANIRLIWLRAFVIPGNEKETKKEVASRDRKFNGQTAGIRMHAHSWLRCTRESGEVKREIWGDYGGKKGEGTKSERKVRRNVKSEISFDSSYIYVSHLSCVQAGCLLSDIWYDIWYFGECSRNIISQLHIHASLPSLFTSSLLALQQLDYFDD